MRKFDLSLRSSRSSYFATFRHQLTILSKTDALDEEKWLDRKSGSAGMPRPISYAVFCLKKKDTRLAARGPLPCAAHSVRTASRSLVSRSSLPSPSRGDRAGRAGANRACDL